MSRIETLINLRKERLAAFVQGFGRIDKNLVDNGIYIAKEIENLKFCEDIDLEYKFYMDGGRQVYSPKLSADLNALLIEHIVPNLNRHKEFYEIGRAISRYSPEELGLIVQSFINKGKSPTDNEKAAKFLEEIKNHLHKRL